MIIKIPTIKKEIVDEKVIVTRNEIDVQIDTSFLAHLKWEEHFQETLKYDLTTYTEMVKAWIKNPDTAKAHFLGMLKLLYCYINSDKLPTFRDFCKLFDYDIADEVLKKISVVLEETGKVVSKN